MKRYIISLLLVLTAVEVWCNFSLAGDTNNSSATAVATNAAPVNLTAEITRAKSENKLLLMEFGSSDSCPPCILFQQKVFSQPEFLAYEKSNLVFVRLDFPLNTDLPPQVQATNIFLAKQFDVFAFPAFVALDHAGKEFWRMPKNDEMTIETRLFQTKEFIALLEDVKKKQP
jgi:thioredoxin-related protein